MYRSTISLLLTLMLLGVGWAQSMPEPTPTPSAEPTPQATPQPAPDATPTPTPTPAAEPEPEPEPEPSKPAKPSRIFISDSENGRVIQMDDMEGTNFIAIGIPGFGLGRLLEPAQVWVDEAGRIYVADKGNNRIVAFRDITGNGWSEMKPYSAPEGVCVSEGKLYIADTGKNRVLVYDRFGGKLLETITHERLTKPNSLWADAKGKIYIGCGQSPPGGMIVQTYISEEVRRFKVFDGKNLASGSSSAPRQVVTHNKKIWFIDSSGHRLVKMDNIRGRNARISGRYGNKPNQYKRPKGIGIDPQGRIYIADTGNDRLIRIEGESGETTIFAGGLNPDKQLRAPSSVFVTSPAPPPPKPEDEKEKKKKKKKKKKFLFF